MCMCLCVWSGNFIIVKVKKTVYVNYNLRHYDSSCWLQLLDDLNLVGDEIYSYHHEDRFSLKHHLGCSNNDLALCNDHLSYREGLGLFSMLDNLVNNVTMIYYGIQVNDFSNFNIINDVDLLRESQYFFKLRGSGDIVNSQGERVKFSSSYVIWFVLYPLLSDDFLLVVNSNVLNVYENLEDCKGGNIKLTHSLMCLDDYFQVKYSNNCKELLNSNFLLVQEGDTFTIQFPFSSTVNVETNMSYVNVNNTNTFEFNIPSVGSVTYYLTYSIAVPSLQDSQLFSKYLNKSFIIIKK